MFWWYVVSGCLLATRAKAGYFYPHLRNDQDVTVTQDTGAWRREENGGLQFPKNLLFSLKFSHHRSPVQLSLRLNENQHQHIPVKIVTADGVQILKERAERDYAFYQDKGEDSAVAVMVRCPVTKLGSPCYIVGSFLHKGKHYLIEPRSEGAEVADDIHVLHKINSVPKDNSERIKDTIVKAVGNRNVKTIHEDLASRTEFKTLLGTLLHSKQRQSLHTRSIVPKKYQIELEMVIAYDIKQIWTQRIPNDERAVLEIITMYYEKIANIMDLQFSTASTPSMTIDIIPLGIIINSVSSANPWVSKNIFKEKGRTYIKDENAVNDFESWVKENKNKLSAFDAVLGFTSFDLTSDGVASGNGTVGIANTHNDDDGNTVSSLCGDGSSDAPLAAGVIEEFSQGDTANSASHELAHTMGVQHDNEYETNGCSDKSHFIMDSGTATEDIPKAQRSNPWTFSTCSVNVMERTMQSIPKDANGKTCLERQTYNKTHYQATMSGPELGELFSLNQQCQLIYGVKSSQCMDVQGWTLEETCYNGIYCSDPKGGSCSRIYVLSGSPCPKGKCYRGDCIAKLPNSGITGK